MSAWIEGDVMFGGDSSVSETTERLHQWASKNCTKAKKICSHGTSRSKGIPPHMSLLFHGHPASDEFINTINAFDISVVEMHGVVKNVTVAQATNMILLSITCDEMCDLFEKLYEAVTASTGKVPKHTLLKNAYKSFLPHITLAHYETQDDAVFDYTACTDAAKELVGLEVTIKNFILREYTKENGAVQVPLCAALLD